MGETMNMWNKMLLALLGAIASTALGWLGMSTPPGTVPTHKSGRPAVAAPSPSYSEPAWCTSEAPPSTTPGGPSYLPQCPPPYSSPPAASPTPFVSPTGSATPPCWVVCRPRPSLSAPRVW